MKTQLIKQFVKRTIIKTIIFTIVMVIVASASKSISPLITNGLALTQMQNSDEMFVLMNTYTRIRPIMNAVYIGIVAVFVYTLGRDTYKFVKTINTEHEKEN